MIFFHRKRRNQAYNEISKQCLKTQREKSSVRGIVPDITERKQYRKNLLRQSEEIILHVVIETLRTAISKPTCAEILLCQRSGKPQSRLHR